MDIWGTNFLQINANLVNKAARSDDLYESVSKALATNVANLGNSALTAASHAPSDFSHGLSLIKKSQAEQEAEEEESNLELKVTSILSGGDGQGGLMAQAAAMARKNQESKEGAEQLNTASIIQEQAVAQEYEKKLKRRNLMDLYQKNSKAIIGKGDKETSTEPVQEEDLSLHDGGMTMEGLLINKRQY